MIEIVSLGLLKHLASEIDHMSLMCKFYMLRIHSGEMFHRHVVENQIREVKAKAIDCI